VTILIWKINGFYHQKPDEKSNYLLLLCKGFDPVGTLRFWDLKSLSLLLIGELKNGIWKTWWWLEVEGLENLILIAWWTFGVRKRRERKRKKWKCFILKSYKKKKQVDENVKFNLVETSIVICCVFIWTWLGINMWILNVVLFMKTLVNSLCEFEVVGLMDSFVFDFDQMVNDSWMSMGVSRD
jgi:hypothetical protein